MGAGAQRPQCYLLIVYTQDEKQQPNFAWSKLDTRKFYRVDYAPALTKIFDDTNADTRFVCDS